jgi:hypothetical protein
MAITRREKRWFRWLLHWLFGPFVGAQLAALADVREGPLPTVSRREQGESLHVEPTRPDPTPAGTIEAE